MKIALAVFVKTPHQSPLKTRLAKVIGTELAIEFYLRSCRAIASVADYWAEQLQEKNVELFRFWAVAEETPEARDFWLRGKWNNNRPHPNWETISQGNGGLGDRLHIVYQSLLDRASLGILMGADAPQISPQFYRPIGDCAKSEFLIGPARDGGFYLFGSGERLDHQLWNSIQYSQDDTLDRLLEKIRCREGIERSLKIHSLPPLSDMDYIEDREQLISDLQELPKRTAAQSELFDWLQKTPKKLDKDATDAD